MQGVHFPVGVCLTLATESSSGILLPCLEVQMLQTSSGELGQKKRE